MKKTFKLYVIAWALLFILFNVIAILFPGWPAADKTTASFWIGYAFINAALVGQLITAGIVFKEQNIKKIFYNFALYKSSYTGLILTFICGAIFMVFSFLPYWIGAIVCSIILVVNIIAVVKAKMATELVSAVDEKIKTATAFIYEIRVDGEALLSRAKSDEARNACKKVSDALKYSDPMSHDALETVENNIRIHFSAFASAVSANDADAIAEEANELLSFINERNAKCKLYK